MAGGGHDYAVKSDLSQAKAHAMAGGGHDYAVKTNLSKAKAHAMAGVGHYNPVLQSQEKDEDDNPVDDGYWDELNARFAAVAKKA